MGARVAKGTLAPEKANQTNERKGEPGHHSGSGCFSNGFCTCRAPATIRAGAGLLFGRLRIITARHSGIVPLAAAAKVR